MSKALNTPITFDVHPEGGELKLKTNDPLLGSNSTIGVNTVVVTYTPSASTPSL
jgi:hypothetical protein